MLIDEYAIIDFFINFGSNKYYDIFVILSLSLPCFSLITLLKKSVVSPFSIPSNYVPPQNRDHSAFDALRCAKASPSATCVTEVNAVCRSTGIFSHNDVSLKNIIKSNITQFQVVVYFFVWWIVLLYTVTYICLIIHSTLRCLLGRAFWPPLL